MADTFVKQRAQATIILLLILDELCLVIIFVFVLINKQNKISDNAVNTIQNPI